MFLLLSILHTFEHSKSGAPPQGALPEFDFTFSPAGHGAHTRPGVWVKALSFCLRDWRCEPRCTFGTRYTGFSRVTSTHSLYSGLERLRVLLLRQAGRPFSCALRLSVFKLPCYFTTKVRRLSTGGGQECARRGIFSYFPPTGWFFFQRKFTICSFFGRRSVVY